MAHSERESSRVSGAAETTPSAEIRGALGTLHAGDDAPHRGMRARVITLLAIMGPGLIVMAGDNDAGGISTYVQAGQNYGTSLLWTLLLLIPVLIVNQEMAVRLGAVSGVGHARLIKERFGRIWGFFAVSDLFILNFLTIATEFMGVSLVAEYFHISTHVAVALAAALLIGITASGNFRRWERAMLILVAASLLILPLAFISHASAGNIFHGLLVPGVQNGFTSDAALLIVAMIGTTVAPWQLFFQQSNVVDKRITPRWLAYERADTVIGAIVAVVSAGILLSASAHAFAGTPQSGKFVDAFGVAHGLAQYVGPAAGAIFAIILFDGSVIGASAVTLSTSYAFADVFGLRHSLHRGFRDAPSFYLTYSAMVIVAAGVVLIPGAPLGLINVAVQALSGILLPSATIFLLLLCNDKAVLGPWANKRWQNVISIIIIGVLLGISVILVLSTLFPQIDVVQLLLWLSGLLVIVLSVVLFRLFSTPEVKLKEDAVTDKAHWRMSPQALLERAKWSSARRAGMWTLRIYLSLAMISLVVKSARLALGH